MESPTTKVRLVEAIRLSSTEHAAGSVLDVSPADAAQLIAAGHAVAVEAVKSAVSPTRPHQTKE